MITTKAKELGEAIQASEEFLNLQKADAAYQSNEQAQMLTEVYNKRRTELAKKAQEENITPEEMNDIRSQIADEFAKLEQNDVIKAFIEAKQSFDEMMGQVDGILRYYVTGEEQGCDSGSCSSCGGGCSH